MRALVVESGSKDEALAMLSEGFCPACRTQFRPVGRNGALVCDFGWTYEAIAEIVENGAIVVARVVEVEP